MKAKKTFRVALIGTDSLRGKEIKNILSAKKFPLTQIEFFDPDVDEEYSKLTQFEKEPKVIRHPSPDSLEGLDLVFLASDEKTNRTFGRLAAAGKFQAVDLASTFNTEEDVPLIVAGVNDEVLEKHHFPLIANPHPATIILSSLFNGLCRRFGLSRAIAFVLQPASAFEQSGIEELASQSVALLSSSALKKSVFKQQIAFNLLSHTEAPDASGFSSEERRIAAEIKRVLADPGFPLSLSLIQAPIFHTYAIMVYLELAAAAAIEDLARLYRASPFFKVGPATAACPVTAISVAGKEPIFIGQIKKEDALPNAFWIWTVTDNLTRGSALNAWEIAKIIFQRKPRGRSSS
jgi:aspartate-semialdehyde dehydrogenase